MSRTHLPRVILTALALLALAPPTAGAWGGRSHWHGGHGWPRDHDLRTLPAGDGPNITAFDPATRTLYVTNDMSNDVSVLDVDRRVAVARIPVGAVPTGLAIHDRTLYVANIADGTVSVIDAARCNARATAGCGAPIAGVSTGGAPLGVAIDAPTDTVYVGDPERDSVAVIDARNCNRVITSGCAAPPVRATAVAGAAFPTVDADTRTLYVPGNGIPEDSGTSVAVIDIRGCNARVATGCAAAPATVEAGQGPLMAIVDPATHTLYVSVLGETGTVSVLDAAHCNALDTSGCGQTAARTHVGSGPAAFFALDRGTLYVPTDATDTVSAIDTARCSARNTAGCGTRWPTLAAGNTPFWISLDAPTGDLYVPNYLDDAVSVLDARACGAQRRTGCRDEAPSVFVDDAFSLAIAPDVKTAYVTHANLHDLVMFDTSRCSARRPQECRPVVGPVPGVSGPFDIAFDDGTDTLYATNQGDRTLVLIDPARCNVRRPGGCAPVKTVQLGDALNVTVDPASHLVYVTDDDHGRLSIIDGRRCNVRVTSGCAVSTVPAGEGAFGVVADPVTGSVYVTNQFANTVTVLDRTGIKATIPVGVNPLKPALDPVTRTLYVPNSAFGEAPGTVSAVDLRTCSVRDTRGCGRPAPLIPTGRTPISVAVDPRTHVAYTTDMEHSTVTVIAGGRRVDTVAVGFFPWSAAVDPASGTVYVTDNAEGRVSFVAAR